MEDNNGFWRGCVTAVGLIAAVITIFEFMTGWSSARQIFAMLANSAPPGLQAPTSVLIFPPFSTQPQSSGVCQEAGGASGFPLSKTPTAPTNGCVLTVEWWVPPNSSNCGIIITTSNPVIPTGAIGSWWYVYPQRPDSQKEEYLAKNPQCKVEDLR